MTKHSNIGSNTIISRYPNQVGIMNKPLIVQKNPAINCIYIVGYTNKSLTCSACSSNIPKSFLLSKTYVYQVSNNGQEPIPLINGKTGAPTTQSIEPKGFRFLDSQCGYATSFSLMQKSDVTYGKTIDVSLIMQQQQFFNKDKLAEFENTLTDFPPVYTEETK